ncbi:MAG: peroxiredoxin [Candidatus Thermoplasmatota archaeon]|jgi:peroxiredoxin (alkyl hydroperoxide reductase subunit C)|nr:peroxiredoxin [Candidatus Thermoplasmatota archaeon]MCL5789155.1 peroxiredoxin [Candidatus Thermoplasmatota archaeon]
MEENRFPLIGERFPELQVETTHGMLKVPDAYKGKWFMLFSHPGDFTPVCTTEFFSFSRRYADFQKLNTELIGLSVDSTISHIEWVNWIEEHLGVKVPFPVIGDSMGRVATRLGMIHPESSSSTVRAVFIVDPNSVVRLIMYYPLEIGRNVDELLRAIKALQMNDKYKVALPANWPENELIGENAINPPPRNVADSKTRMEQSKGFAWWLTYKEVPANEVQEAKKFVKKKE